MRGKLTIYVAVIVLLVLVNVSVIGLESRALACTDCGGGVVDKSPSEAFTVEIGFKNVGKTEGTWRINIAFEGEKWTWTGTPQNLTLKSYKSKILRWNGTVPAEAPIDSVARLIVYYDDSFTALKWWIHVVPKAELAITSSTVR
ncbi:MAG: hypothetical protein QHH24_00115 [Candidatus Bathyarchaeota archaeon]|nr:hypothetical protein [Candidatus Bathyarchaeota archaeon]